MSTTRSMRLPPISRRALLAGASALALSSLTARTATTQGKSFPELVDLAWLAERATHPGLRLFDVSSLHIWKDRHIASAAHAWWRDTVDPNYPVFGAVLTQGDEQAHRQRVLDSLELSLGDDVVVYDNQDGFRAARLVWFLRFLGFERAALLNASYDDWNAARFPIESPPAAGTPPVVDPQPGYYLVTTQLLDRLDSPELQLVDIRTSDERADDLRGDMPIGQIPGSIHLPWTALLDERGRVASAAGTLAAAASAGLAAERPTVIYGRFGVDAALPWLTLTAAGFTSVQPYDRGWAEWSITPGLPREPLA